MFYYYCIIIAFLIFKIIVREHALNLDRQVDLLIIHVKYINSSHLHVKMVFKCHEITQFVLYATILSKIMILFINSGYVDCL